MCRFQKLCISDKGYVTKCCTCGSYQVGFGTMMVTLDDQELSNLKKLVTGHQEELAFQDNEMVKNIVIPTSSKQLKLLLCKRELNDLNDILDTAECEETALAMLELFNI